MDTFKEPNALSVSSIGMILKRPLLFNPQFKKYILQEKMRKG